MTALELKQLSPNTASQKRLAAENIARCKAYRAMKENPPPELSLGTILHHSKAEPLTITLGSIFKRVA